MTLFTSTASIRYLPHVDEGPYTVDLYREDMYFSTTSFESYDEATEFCARGKFALKNTVATILECRADVDCVIDHFTATLWHGEAVQSHKSFPTYSAARDWVCKAGYAFDPTPTDKYLKGRPIPRAGARAQAPEPAPAPEGPHYDEARIFICITEKSRVIHDRECARGYSVIIDLQPHGENLPPASMINPIAFGVESAIDQVLKTVCGGFDKVIVTGKGETMPSIEKGIEALLTALNEATFPAELDTPAGADPGAGGSVDEFADLNAPDLEATKD